MTRINCVPPEQLSGKHLVAEYSELPRVFTLVRKRIKKGHRPSDIDIPEKYALGPGHVKFFYDKLGWLKKRQESLIQEMLRRGYRPTFTGAGLLDGIPNEWAGEWEPDQAAVEINQARLRERGG